LTVLSGERHLLRQAEATHLLPSTLADTTNVQNCYKYIDKKTEKCQKNIYLSEFQAFTL